MAYLRNFKCTRCGDEKREIDFHLGDICSSCIATTTKLNKENHMKYLSSLRIERRIEFIEEQLYDFYTNILPDLATKNIPYC